MKRCGKCCLEKDESEFNKDKKRPSGLGNRCKLCKSIEHKEYILKYPEKFKKKYCEDLPKWREDNKEKLKEYSKKDRERKKLNIRKKPKSLDEINYLKEEANKNQAEWNSLSEERKKEWQKKYRQTATYKIQRHARDAIYYGIKFGYIERPKNCEICMKECKPEGHHFDYSKPKEVQWVCSECHYKIHEKKNSIPIKYRK
ncbi:hypothetical protein UFOVP264_7 [uncultured Caudovirales phage]|uniref:Recombination endonuclease VII n=1 Tax=uncultured Caudovirales phage TaxID=2100421 RepID=A0A6J5LGD4_9CAUD|nr:hypothetical protein UFOVP264_7 [uncultured Caudovirales phage]